MEKIKKTIINFLGKVENLLFPEKETLLERFTQRFPGKCPICSFHQFGIGAGFNVGKLSSHDNCPEKPAIK